MRLAAVDADNPQSVLPGHYYSPIPSLTEIRRDADRLFGRRDVRDLPGLDLRTASQSALLRDLRRFYDEMPFGREAVAGLRYALVNDHYAHTDGVLLYCMLRHARPARIVEIGSGYSSCLMLDVNDQFFNGSIRLTFIDPDPGRLYQLAGDACRLQADVRVRRVQDVPIDTFATLNADDILFVDSSHVSKTGSDVNYIVFDVLPRLKSGVYVHFHDVFYAFEYPEKWVCEGRSYNEAYLLRAFLQFNCTFHVVLMNGLVEVVHSDFLREQMPLCLPGTGSSLWIRRL